MKKNSDYWKSFVNTGKIDDYLHYIACTQEESMDELIQVVDITRRNKEMSILSKEIPMQSIGKFQSSALKNLNVEL